VHPEGVQIPRFYCPLKRATISLLPAFLASRLSATLDEVEAVIDTVERASSIAAAVDAVRPASDDDAVTSSSAARWVRRRLRPMKAALLALVTLLPELSGCEAKLGAIRARLGVERALVRLREIAGAHLHALAPPLGFRTRESR
jgi:hypothetical protein